MCFIIIPGDRVAVRPPGGLAGVHSGHGEGPHAGCQGGGGQAARDRVVGSGLEAERIFILQEIKSINLKAREIALGDDGYFAFHFQVVVWGGIGGHNFTLRVRNELFGQFT